MANQSDSRNIQEVESLLREASSLVTDKRLPEAAQVLRRARSLDPGDPKVASLLATVLFRLGDYSEAYEVYQGLVERFPEEPSLWLNLGLCADALGNVAEAVEYLERAVRADPDDQKAHAHLGHLYAKLGDQAAARREFMLAGRILSENLTGPEALVRHHVDLELPHSDEEVLLVHGRRLVARTRGTLYVRRRLVGAHSARLAAEPINRQAHGHSLPGAIQDEATGELVAATGPGGLVACVPDGRLELLQVEQGAVLARQEAVVAFTDGLTWDNASLPEPSGKETAVLRLSGTGSLVLRVPEEVVRVRLQDRETWTVSPERLVAWSALLLPTEATQETEALWPVFQGPGWLLLS